MTKTSLKSPPRSAKAAAPKKKERQQQQQDIQLHTMATTASGQLKLNPHYTLKQAQLAAKREYNRRNSIRSRVRHKHKIEYLQQEYDRLRQREHELLQINKLLLAQVEACKKKEKQHSFWGRTTAANGDAGRVLSLAEQEQYLMVMTLLNGAG